MFTVELTSFFKSGAVTNETTNSTFTMGGKRTNISKKKIFEKKWKHVNFSKLEGKYNTTLIIKLVNIGKMSIFSICN